LCGVYQYNQKNKVQINNIAIKLVQNNVNAHKTALKFHIYNSIQTTANGGISAAAIATPAILSHNLENLNDNTATTAEKIAIKKSIIFGLLRDSISEVSKFNHINKVKTNPINIEIIMEKNKTLKDIRKKF
jgi:hypothetical protein